MLLNPACGSFPPAISPTVFDTKICNGAGTLRHNCDLMNRSCRLLVYFVKLLFPLRPNRYLDPSSSCLSELNAGEDGGWEVQQRGRRPPARRTLTDSAASPVLQRPQQRKSFGGSSAPQGPSLQPVRQQQQQQQPHPGLSSSKQWPAVGAANGKVAVAVAPVKGLRPGGAASLPHHLPQSPQHAVSGDAGSSGASHLPGSCRSSGEYNLWGSGGGEEAVAAMSLCSSIHPSSSRDSLAAPSEASCAAASPPTTAPSHHSATLLRLRSVSEAAPMPLLARKTATAGNMLGAVGSGSGSFAVSGGGCSTISSTSTAAAVGWAPIPGPPAAAVGRMALSAPSESLAGGWAFDGAGSAGSGTGGFSLFCNFPVVRGAAAEPVAPLSAGRIPAF